MTAQQILTLVPDTGRPGAELLPPAAGGGEVVDLVDEHDPRRLVAAWLLGFRSRHTRRGYAGDLAVWLTWCASYRIDPLTVRRAHVDAWARHLEESLGEAGSTVSRRLSAVSSWYAYLVDEDLLQANPAARAKRPTVDHDQTSTVGLTREQARNLLAAAAADTGPQALRTHAAVRLMLCNGFRVDSLIQADVEHLGHDRGHRTLRVKVKGGLRRTAPLAPATAAAIDTYLAHRAAAAGLADVEQLAGPLLATAGGGRLDQHALWNLTRRLAKTAGVPAWRKISPHSLRHAFITLSLDAGVPLRDVQDAAGHRDPRTTRRYDHARHTHDRNPTYTLTAWLA